MDWKVVIEELERSGLTQREIADFSGCSQPYVSQLKSGRRKKPTFSVGLCLTQLQKNAKKQRESRA